VDHWEEGGEWDVHFLSLVVTYTAGGCMGEGAEVVWFAKAILGHPSDATVFGWLVGWLVSGWEREGGGGGFVYSLD